MEWLPAIVDEMKKIKKKKFREKILTAAVNKVKTLEWVLFRFYSRECYGVILEEWYAVA